MNSTPEIINSPPDPTPATEPADVGCPDASRRGRGKIACLPKKVRDHINQMLEDGVRYAQIKENLGEHGKDLTLDNISQWKKRGHQHWLKEQFWREEMRARMDAFTDVLGNTDPAQLPIVGLQMSLTQLCEQLRDLGPGSRKDQFEEDADKYLRMLNTISRLSKSLLSLHKFQRDSASATAVELKRLNPNRRISEAEETAMQDRSDDFFGWKSAARLKPDADSVRTESPPSPFSAPTPVGPLPPAGVPGPNCSSRHQEALISEQPAHNEAPRAVTANSPAATIAPKSQIQTQTGISTPVGPLSPAGTPESSCSSRPEEALISEQPNAKTESPQLCPQCQHILPPLTPDGQLPWPACWFCGVRLLPPNTELCPNCRQPLPPLDPNGQRPHPDCRLCGAPVPPPPANLLTH